MDSSAFLSSRAGGRHRHRRRRGPLADGSVPCRGRSRLGPARVTAAEHVEDANRAIRQDVADVDVIATSRAAVLLTDRRTPPCTDSPVGI